MGAVIWKISENSNKPGYWPPAAGLDTQQRMGPVGVGMSTVSSMIVMGLFCLF
jgi:hypothetical protein